MITRSSLATLAPKPQTTGVPVRIRTIPWGVCVHTTGSGVPKAAAQRREDPLDVAVRYYTSPGANFPHYVIGGDGKIVQIADEALRARHAGIDGTDRQLYLGGTWRAQVSSTALARWVARWPGKDNPLQLFPSKSPNEDYLGVELVPQLVLLPDGGLFLPAQYTALGALIQDVGDRYQIPLTGHHLVGHEDLEPLQRWTGTGGWDPGALRAKPSFFWDRLPPQAVS